MACVASQWIFLEANACLSDCVVGSLKRNASRTMLVSRTSRRASLATEKTGSGKLGSAGETGSEHTSASLPVIRPHFPAVIRPQFSPVIRPHFFHFPGDHVKAEQAALDR